MFMKKWWLKAVFPDGKIWTGWINTVEKDKKDFPLTIKGTFWTECKNNSANGQFELGDGKYDGNFVVTNALRKPELDYSKYVQGSREHAQAIDYSMQYEKEWSKHTFKIEDCLDLDMTYIQEF